MDEFIKFDFLLGKQMSAIRQYASSHLMRLNTCKQDSLRKFIAKTNGTVETNKDLKKEEKSVKRKKKEKRRPSIKKKLQKRILATASDTGTPLPTPRLCYRDSIVQRLVSTRQTAIICRWADPAIVGRPCYCGSSGAHIYSRGLCGILVN